MCIHVCTSSHLYAESNNIRLHAQAAISCNASARLARFDGVCEGAPGCSARQAPRRWAGRRCRGSGCPAGPCAGAAGTLGGWAPGCMARNVMNRLLFAVHAARIQQTPKARPHLSELTSTKMKSVTALAAARSSRQVARRSFLAFPWSSRAICSRAFAGRPRRVMPILLRRTRSGFGGLHGVPMLGAFCSQTVSALPCDGLFN